LYTARRFIIIVVALSVVTWVSYFASVRDFGIYEDDYAYIGYPTSLYDNKVVGYPTEWDWSRLGAYIKGNFVHWFQGRPTGLVIARTCIFLGSKIGGLHAIYLFGFGFIALNTILVFLLLRKYTPEVAAVTGALVFCLCPADTTKILLTHSLQNQPSVTFLLIASISYLAGKRPLSYLFILGALTTYETAVMPFFAIPLLKGSWGQKTMKELVGHAFIIFALIAVVTCLRVFLNESRVLETLHASYLTTIIKLVGNLASGPLIVLGTLLVRPITAVLDINKSNLIFIGVMFPALIWWFYNVDSGNLGPPIENRCFFKRRLLSWSIRIRVPENLKKAAHISVVGIVMLVLAYGLSFTHRTLVASGRETSVHLAASVASAIIAAGIFWAMFSIGEFYQKKRTTVALTALYFSLLIGFQLVVQKDYVKSWRNQRRFWRNVVLLCPDLQDGTLVFVDARGLPETKYIKSNSWADAIVLQEVFRFPKKWREPPHLFVVNEELQKSFERVGERVKWQVPAAMWDSHSEYLPRNNVIWLEVKQGVLTRRRGAIEVDGTPFVLKEQPSVRPVEYPKGVFYKYLISN
jgi:hypothetical protein